MPLALHTLDSLLATGALPIGLGASRLGSVNGATPAEAHALLSAALDEGIRFFDTSNIYGQGDSEQLIGKTLGQRDDCAVCSKAGKYLDWKKRLLTPLKGALRRMTRRSEKTRKTVAAARAKPMPTNWDPSFLIRSLEGSLRRLNRPRIEIFMLHSPDSEVLRRGDAIDALERAQTAGKIGVIGVSVDDVKTAETALQDKRILALQIPLRPGETDFDAISLAAANSGVDIIAREILGGVLASNAITNTQNFAQNRIIEMIERPEIALAIIGTTRMSNLRASIASARMACKAQRPEKKQ